MRYLRKSSEPRLAEAARYDAQARDDVLTTVARMADPGAVVLEVDVFRVALVRWTQRPIGAAPYTDYTVVADLDWLVADDRGLFTLNDAELRAAYEEAPG